MVLYITSPLGKVVIEEEFPQQPAHRFFASILTFVLGLGMCLVLVPLPYLGIVGYFELQEQKHNKDSE